jgi:hypothetical protein
MSKVSAKQRVEQLKEWMSWFTNTSKKAPTPVRKERVSNRPNKYNK